MTDLSVTEATLEIDAPIDGRVFVWAEPGGLVAELAKTAGQSVTLGLASGSYTVVVDHGGRMEEVDFELARGESLRLSELGLRSADLAWNRLRGGGGAPERHEAFSLGIFPSIRSRSDEILVQHAAFSLVATAADRVQGAQISIAANLASADVRGLQMTVGSNLAGGPISGMQVSVGGNLARGVAGPGQLSVGGNVSEGKVRGAQTSVGFNVATALQGVQSTVGFNVAGPMQGLQMSVGANVATQARGMQLAVGPNVAAEMHGLQLSVGPQVANKLDGAQISLINVGGTVEGAQIGLINVAKEVTGTQVGLVNVAGKMKGAPIGLVSVAGNGYNHVWAMANDTSHLAVGLTSGGSRLYTTVEAGVRPDGGLWTYGLGLGWHAPLGHGLFLDVDTTALSARGTAVGTDSLGLIVRSRALMGVELLPRLALVGGPTLSVLPIGEPDDVTRLNTFEVGSLPLWPGLTLGIRI
jgi:hypothetical protein